MKLENASVSWLDSGLPYSNQFDDVYFSRDDEMAESQHVFLEANNLLQRWQTSSDSTQAFTLAEIGFGSGLNFLLVWKLWRNCDQRPQQLNYLGFEKHPLRFSDLERLYRQWPTLRPLSEQLLAMYPDHSAGCHRLCLPENVYLNLYYGDAYEQLRKWHRSANCLVDCWFLDGFSPRQNPELWATRLFELIAEHSHAASTLSTYSVAGSVRNHLTAAGFDVAKRPGHSRKRHMLVATPSVAKKGNSSKPAENRGAPWFHYPKFTPRRRTAIVIGAGLAGCSTAFSLAQRGWQVTVIERAESPASAASGNRQLALRCRIYRSYSPLSEFFLHCFLFAQRQFKMLRREQGVRWHASGVIQLVSAMHRRGEFSDSELRDLYPEQVIFAISQIEASERAGVALTESGFYLPSGGWVEPHSLCQGYLSHPNIRLQTSTSINRIEYREKEWVVADDDGDFVSAPVAVVVIANSYAATQFAQAAELPLQGVRGQVTVISACPRSHALKVVVCGERTVFPAQCNAHSISASYAPNDGSTQLREEDDLSNLKVAARSFAQLKFRRSQISDARVSLRGNTSDFIPVVGMLPDAPAMQKKYARLARNAKTQFAATGSYYSGLYINVAHASNGLASCPLSSEYLASLINHEPSPLSKEMMDCLNPARFLINRLKQQR